MLSVYNEFERPIELISNLKTDKLIILKRISGNPDKVLDVRISKKLIIKTPADVDNLNQRLLNTSNMTEPLPILYLQLGTIFNRTEFAPVIINSNNKYETASQKALLMLSIKLNGRKLFNIKNDYSFILDTLVTDKEVSIFVSINKKEYPFGVTLFNEETQMLEDYRFFNNNGGIRLIKDEKPVYNKDFVTKRIELFERQGVKIFRPSKPTYLIFALEHMTLPKIIRTVDNYNIITVKTFDEEYENILSELITLNYNAVTIYTKGMTETQIKKFVDKAKTYMSIVYTMDENGSIEKIQLC